MVQFNKLRLSGFKSFVDPAELHIQQGLTGIVGPNGCGKSNLVEALRWAMGETSAKSMRGSEMDDVIFAGSANRPSRNIAEVLLSLDNSDRTAPAAFNDDESLEVSRRIERGSGSNYKVNGRDVRARDVQLLFADSATGAHSTALVSQGRIGALINAKPTARRALLEEAAGITGLHSRRHEAELRLRAAETNLERLDDVIATLEAQHAGLKKQARQATRYKNLASHIRRHEAILLYVQRKEAEAALAEARHALEAAGVTVGGLSQSVTQASSEQAAAAAALPELRQREAAAAAALQRLLVDRENLEREKAQLEAAQNRARQHLAEIDGDRARAQEQVEDARGAVARLAEEESGLSAAESDDAARREAAGQALDQAETRNAAAEAALAEQLEALATDEAKSASLERRVGELTQRVERLRSQVAQIAEERGRLEAEQADDQPLAEAQASLNRAEQALAQARETLDSAAQGHGAAREAEKSARGAFQEAASKRDKRQAEINALAKILESDQADIWPPIVDALQVEPGYETALGAALGDDLSASANEGAPVHWDSLPAYPVDQALPEGATALSELVRAPEALGRRLTQIGVVADEAQGQALQSRLKPGQRLVTRAGGLWRWDGLTVLAEAPTAAAKRLAQKNHLAELRRDLPALESQVASLKARRDDAAAQAERAGQAERQAREALDRSLTQIDGARERHGRLAQQAAAAASRLSGLADSAQRLAGELDEAEAALAQTVAERAALPDLAARRNAVTEQRAALADDRAALAEARALVDRLEREAESRRQRLSAIASEQATWTSRAEASEAHMNALAGRRAETQAELDQLANLPDEMEQRRATLADQIDQAEEKRQAAADDLARGETRQGAADKALKGAEQALAEAREARVRAEAAVEHCEQALTTLAERVAERLECRPEEVLELAQLDPSQELPDKEQVETKLARLLRERDNMGPVNLRAEQEAEELDQQITGLGEERADLVSAIARLRQGIASLNKEGRQRLLEAFEQVNGHFSELFVQLFGGGRAYLKLTEAEDPLEAGLEVMASPPGKRLQVLSLLSGGEQALTALALLFAVFLTNPAPICVLDEVDAPLDDANVDRFCTLVDELAERTKTRFLIITHHRMTMARVDRLYGVTMAERGVSQLVSVDLDAAEDLRESA
ncbi:MAG: chromosome segregation protein SMC [Pseudomonadota bacterium]